MYLGWKLNNNKSLGKSPDELDPRTNVNEAVHTEFYMMHERPQPPVTGYSYLH